MDNSKRKIPKSNNAMTILSSSTVNENITASKTESIARIVRIAISIALYPLPLPQNSY